VSGGTLKWGRVAGGVGVGVQILFQPCALSILGKVLCLCLFLVIGSFDTQSQHQKTTRARVCVCVYVRACSNPCVPAAKWQNWLKHLHVGLFLLLSSRTVALCINHTQDLFSNCSCWTMHTVLLHRLHYTTGYSLARNDTQTMLLVDESIKLFTLTTCCTSESLQYCLLSHIQRRVLCKR
jgi:hypothetical protein